MFTEVRNVSPQGARELRVDGETLIVEPGGVIEVPPEVAGTPARWRVQEVDDAGTPVVDDLTPSEAVVWLSLQHTRQRAGHLEVFDLGSGLLAQAENWRLASDDPEAPAPDPLATGLPPVAETGTENS